MSSSVSSLRTRRRPNAPAVTMTANDGYAFRGTWGTRPEGVYPVRIF